MNVDWRHRAGCRDVDPELFFPLGTKESAATQTERAKAVCARCPVKRDCLDFALVTHLKEGVYGGLDETERAARRRSWIKAQARQRKAGVA